MRFLQPGLFYVWAALLAVPIILYLFRPRPRTVLTSTLPFFKWLAREHQDNAWLRRLKQLLSLLMTLCVIAAGAAALGQLVVSPAEDELETVVILVDRSASMEARKGDGPTCHEKAIRQLRERLAGLPAGVGVSVIAYDRRPEVLLARTVDRREVERTLDSVEVRPVAGDPEPALSLAHRLAALETPAAIWHVTDYSPELLTREKSDDDEEREASADSDTAPEEPAEPEETPESTSEEKLASDIEVKDFFVGLPQPINAGITAFQLRRVPLQQARLGYEAFVQIRSSANEPLAAELEVIREGDLVQLRKLTIPPGGVETLLVPIETQAAFEEGEEKESSEDDSTSKEDSQGETAGRLTLKLNVEGDVLETDNVLHAWIPKLKPIQVLWLSEKPDAFMQLAFSTITGSDDIQILQGSPSSWPPKEPVDVVIFDGWVPDEWPSDVEVIAIEPPKSSGPIHTAKIPGDGVPIDRLRVSEREHPLLYGVATERISLRQRIILDSTGPLQPLWTGPSGPVLVAGESQGQRVLVTAFRPEDSDRFPLMTSFPIFLANSVYWAAENRMSRVSGNSRRTGEIVQLEGENLSWPSAATGEAEGDAVELTGEWNELTRPGLWETDTGQRGSAAMLAVPETVLPFDATEEVAAASSDDADSALSAVLRGDLVPLLMWSMLVLLLLESWLYHKHAV